MLCVRIQCFDMTWHLAPDDLVHITLFRHSDLNTVLLCKVTAVTAYFSSKQLQLFGLAERCTWRLWPLNKTYVLTNRVTLVKYSVVVQPQPWTATNSKRGGRGLRNCVPTGNQHF